MSQELARKSTFLGGLLHADANAKDMNRALISPDSTRRTCYAEAPIGETAGRHIMSAAGGHSWQHQCPLQWLKLAMKVAAATL